MPFHVVSNAIFEQQLHEDELTSLRDQCYHCRIDSRTSTANIFADALSSPSCVCVPVCGFARFVKLPLARTRKPPI